MSQRNSEFGNNFTTATGGAAEYTAATEGMAHNGSGHVTGLGRSTGPVSRLLSGVSVPMPEVPNKTHVERIKALSSGLTIEEALQMIVGEQAGKRESDGRYYLGNKTEATPYDQSLPGIEHLKDAGIIFDYIPKTAFDKPVLSDNGQPIYEVIVNPRQQRFAPKLADALEAALREAPYKKIAGKNIPKGSPELTDVMIQMKRAGQMDHSEIVAQFLADLNKNTPQR